MFPKVHKEGSPGRPVVSSIICHAIRISKHIDHQLQPHVKNSNPMSKPLRISCGKPKQAEAVAQRCSVKKVFLEVSQNSQENTCGRVWHRCFLVNFVKFLRTPFFIEHLCWLFLSKEKIPDNSILVTINIRFLYTNIPNKEGIEAV